MARGDQLGRQWTIIHTLVACKSGKTASELAEDLGCTPRTVYRDLEALQSGGFPITTDTRENRSYWRILEGKSKVPPAFSLSELMALYFGRDMLRTYRGTVFYDAIESLLSKIKATLPPSYLDYLDRIQNRVDTGPVSGKDYSKSGPVIADLNRAIVEEKKVRITYFSMSRKKESGRIIHPYRLRHVKDTLYLIGYCERRKEVRTFAVDRIGKAFMTNDGFRIPTSFDMENFLKDSFGIYQGPPVSVKIRFLEPAAGYIRERVWHESQQITEQPDGSLIFTATVAGVEEIGHWVLRWGAGAQVLAPKSLCKTIKNHAEAMATHYGSMALDVTDEDDEKETDADADTVKIT